MSTQGNCPRCGADLRYDGRRLSTDDGHSEPVFCTECNWHGYENYRETFTGHEDLDPNDPNFAPAPSPAPAVPPVYAIQPPPADKAEDGTQSYRVVYEIDVMARDPEEAARQVEEIFHDPGSAPFFTILDSAGNKTDVDLFERGLEERYGPVVELRPVPPAQPPQTPEPPAA